MITLIAGTNRQQSYTHKLALIYQRLLAELDCQSRIFSMSSLPDRVLLTDLYGQRSEEFAKIQLLVSETEKFIFLLPEYNGSFPGVVKLFIDCLDFPGSFKNKKAALVGLSSGMYGNVRGVDHFTGICHYIGLDIMPLKLHIPLIKKELVDERLINEVTLNYVKGQVAQFARF